MRYPFLSACFVTCLFVAAPARADLITYRFNILIDELSSRAAADSVFAEQFAIGDQGWFDWTYDTDRVADADGLFWRTTVGLTFNLPEYQRTFTYQQPGSPYVIGGWNMLGISGDAFNALANLGGPAELGNTGQHRP